MLAGALLAVAAVAVLASAPVSAVAGTGKCIWYDADIPESGGTVPLQDCGLHSGQTAEATYYWSDEARVIYEPRAMAFDYSAYGGLDPFATEYSLRKANELFPVTTDGAVALAKLHYAQLALSAKTRAIETRKGVSSSDACVAVPAIATDHAIRSDEIGMKLPPSPRPDRKTGTYTYSLSTTLTSAQRAVVLAGLVRFESAIAGSKQPQLIEWQSGDAHPPVITFNNSPGGFEEDDRDAEATAITIGSGRDGLTRWVNGDINLTDVPDRLAAWTVMHEILHVYGFDHLPGPTFSSVMSPTLSTPAVENGWFLGTEPTPVIHGEVDRCTKAGIDAAPAPE